MEKNNEKKTNSTKKATSMLDMMKLSAQMDDDGVIPEEEMDARAERSSDREKYMDYYDDVKQPCKYIKEDW
ncbi:MAG TPA: hypothetical protein DHU65_02110 [Clostridiales bacterium]|nr:hypothetical protein [Clostridiales bacterium]